MRRRIDSSSRNGRNGVKKKGFLCVCAHPQRCSSFLSGFIFLTKKRSTAQQPYRMDNSLPLAEPPLWQTADWPFDVGRKLVAQQNHQHSVLPHTLTLSRTRSKQVTTCQTHSSRPPACSLAGCNEASCASAQFSCLKSLLRLCFFSFLCVLVFALPQEKQKKALKKRQQ